MMAEMRRYASHDKIVDVPRDQIMREWLHACQVHLVSQMVTAR